MILLQMRMKTLIAVMMNDFVIFLMFYCTLLFGLWVFVPWILAPSECMVCIFNSALWILNFPVLAHFVAKKGE